MPITTTPSGGPQGEFSTYTPIYSQTLSSAATSITFSNIPTTFTDLVLVASIRADAVTFNNMNFPLIRLNGDSSSGLYSVTSLFSRNTGSGDTSISSRASSQNEINFGGVTTTNMTSGIFSTWITTFLNYSNNTTNKTILNRISSVSNLTASDGLSAGVGLWRNTAPINSISLIATNSGNFVIGSTFTIYGIKAAATQFIPTKAAGGDVVTSDGTYAYHTFLSSGVFKPAQSLTVDYLVVASGGGGGGADGGGGGAGGFRLLSAQTVSAATTVTIGAGANGGIGYGKVGSNGSNSSFGATSATGGGGGGVEIPSPSANPGSGGSGGGAAVFKTNQGSGNAGSYSPVEGYAGGQGSGVAGNIAYTPNYGAGGGGGAGAVGSQGLASAGGAGGVGAGGTSYTNYTIINAMGSATSTGVLSGGNYYYAGGGGGGGYSASSNSGTNGAGGLGGGTDGQMYANASNATANTGGGGGGGGANSSTNYNGGAGGSGIVIVRYTL
jgi:hypothetical protein